MCFILMNKFGLIGASLSFVVSNLIFAFLQIMVYLRISSSSIKKLLIRKADVKLVANIFKNNHFFLNKYVVIKRKKRLQDKISNK